jgi:hypothetical protein
MISTRKTKPFCWTSSAADKVLVRRKRNPYWLVCFADNDKNLNIAVNKLPYAPGLVLKDHLNKLRSSQATNASDGAVPSTVTTEPSTKATAVR